MIVTISGTNRPSSNTLRITRIVESILKNQGRQTAVLDLAALPTELLDPARPNDSSNRRVQIITTQ